jgi:hypothetical protein
MAVSRMDRSVAAIPELAAAHDPEIARTQCVTQLRQDAQLIEAAVDFLALEDERLPAVAVEAGRCIFGYGSDVLGIQLPQHVNRLEQLFAGWCSPELKGVEKFRRVPPDVRVTVADQGQIVARLDTRV